MRQCVDTTTANPTKISLAQQLIASLHSTIPIVKNLLAERPHTTSMNYNLHYVAE
jgi:hypothetical protein